MKRFGKYIFVAAVLIGAALTSMADRGIGRKSKNKVDINIRGSYSASYSLKESISLNLKLGLKYTGSLLMNQQNTSRSIMNDALVTYQKGNTVYIVPYKQKIAVAEIGPSYSGVKFILRAHK